MKRCEYNDKEFCNGRSYCSHPSYASQNNCGYEEDNDKRLKEYEFYREMLK